MAEQKKLQVTDIRISFISGADKHVAVDVADVQDVLKVAGSGKPATALAFIAGLGEALLNGHDDAEKVEIGVTEDGKSLAVSTEEAQKLFA
jgi:hypothetical protein